MNQTNIAVLVILVKLVVLTQTIVLAHLTFTAYRRSEEEDLLVLSVGFGSIMAGVVIGGVAYHFLGFGSLVGVLSESLFIALGLGLMILSLYGYR